MDVKTLILKVENQASAALSEVTADTKAAKEAGEVAAKTLAEGFASIGGAARDLIPHAAKINEQLFTLKGTTEEAAQKIIDAARKMGEFGASADEQRQGMAVAIEAANKYGVAIGKSAEIQEEFALQQIDATDALKNHELAVRLMVKTNGRADESAEAVARGLRGQTDILKELGPRGERFAKIIDSISDREKRAEAIMRLANKELTGQANVVDKLRDKWGAARLRMAEFTGGFDLLGPAAMGAIGALVAAGAAVTALAAKITQYGIAATKEYIENTPKYSYQLSILNEKQEEFRQTLGSVVAREFALDEATRELSIAFMVMDKFLLQSRGSGLKLAGAFEKVGMSILRAALISAQFGEILSKPTATLAEALGIIEHNAASRGVKMIQKAMVDLIRFSDESRGELMELDHDRAEAAKLEAKRNEKDTKDRIQKMLDAEAKAKGEAAKKNAKLESDILAASIKDKLKALEEGRAAFVASEKAAAGAQIGEYQRGQAYLKQLIAEQNNTELEVLRQQGAKKAELRRAEEEKTKEHWKALKDMSINSGKALAEGVGTSLAGLAAGETTLSEFFASTLKMVGDSLVQYGIAAFWLGFGNPAMFGVSAAAIAAGIGLKAWAATQSKGKSSSGDSAASKAGAGAAGSSLTSADRSASRGSGGGQEREINVVWRGPQFRAGVTRAVNESLRTGEIIPISGRPMGLR